MHSFDYDPQSVACAAELKRRYFADAAAWVVEPGDVLDRAYLARIGSFDVVYSWGVLHHTGDLWRALENVAALVAPGGTLFIALYNDQGWRSQLWTAVKRKYNRGALWRRLITGAAVPGFLAASAVHDLGKFRNPLARYRRYREQRGMSYYHDCLDWLGGYPFEVAGREKVVEFLRDRGFDLRKLKNCGRKLGNNEFVLTRRPERGAPNAPSKGAPRLAP